MSDDLIKRSDAIDELMHIIPYKLYHNGEYIFLLNKRECLKVIKAIPSADKPQGEWTNAGILTVHCSNCKSEFHELEAMNYCPNCGARMKGADDESS